MLLLIVFPAHSGCQICYRQRDAAPNTVRLLMPGRGPTTPLPPTTPHHTPPHPTLSHSRLLNHACHSQFLQAGHSRPCCWHCAREARGFGLPSLPLEVKPPAAITLTTQHSTAQHAEQDTIVCQLLSPLCVLILDNSWSSELHMTSSAVSKLLVFSP